MAYAFPQSASNLAHLSAMAKPSGKLRMKLLVDKTSKKVLFAEAGKEVVDFLFSILALPVADVISLLSKKSMVGCLTNLYDSVESLEDTYLQPSQDKNLLLKPRTSSPAFFSGSALTWIDGSCSEAKITYYRCSNYTDYRCNYFTDDARATCPRCTRPMATPLIYVPPVAGATGTNGGGFVKSVVTYMVTDDLTVSPMSTISSITLLNRFGVKEVGSLEERTADVGMNEGLKILKASLQSTTVLTDVFLVKRKL